MESNWEKYVPVVRYHAARLCKRTKVSFDDLFQSGCVGLFEALGRLDEDLSLPQQSHFVRQYIWHHVLRAIRELQHPVYIPLYLNRKINNNEIHISSISESFLDIEEGSQDKKSYSKSPHPNFVTSSNEVVSRCHYRRIVELSIYKLLESEQIDVIECLCFLLFHGLFNYPRFPLEDISKIIEISANTVSKKVLKVMRVLKVNVPIYYEKDSIFNGNGE